MGLNKARTHVRIVFKDSTVDYVDSIHDMLTITANITDCSNNSDHFIVFTDQNGSTVFHSLYDIQSIFLTPIKES